MPTKPIPEGFNSITPYLFAEGASRLIDFISTAFEGELMFQQKRPDGTIMHATIRVGDSMLMLADPTPEFRAMPTSIYLYVPDCDTVYQRALDSGGVSVFPMMTLPSGQRYGGIKDPCGNIWWVATQVENVPPDEQERRWKQFKMPQVTAHPKKA
jgi:PhnB protein